MFGIVPGLYLPASNSTPQTLNTVDQVWYTTAESSCCVTYSGSVGIIILKIDLVQKNETYFNPLCNKYQCCNVTWHFSNHVQTVWSSTLPVPPGNDSDYRRYSIGSHARESSKTSTGSTFRERSSSENASQTLHRYDKHGLKL